MYANLEELIKSDLSLEEKILHIPIILIIKNHHNRQNLELYLEKKQFNQVLAVENTKEALDIISENKNRMPIQISVSEANIGEKYFVLEDFFNLPGLTAEPFWENCIKDEVMSIIGKMGVPISYDKFIDRIHKFGTVDNSLADNMGKITEKAKDLDTLTLLRALVEEKKLPEIKSHFILSEKPESNYIKLQDDLLQSKHGTYIDPINVDEIFQKIKNQCIMLIAESGQKKEDSDPEADEVFPIPPLESKLPEKQKQVVNHARNQINILIDQRYEHICLKYKDKVDRKAMNRAKHHIYKLMLYLAYVNDITYFKAFTAGLKGLFTQLEDDLLFTNIKHVFLFNNMMKGIISLKDGKINENFKKMGSIILMLSANFDLQDNPIPGYDQTTLNRSMGIILIWSTDYFAPFFKTLNQAPGYVNYIMVKENRTKPLGTKHYQNLYNRFSSLNSRVFQVEKCSV